MRIKIEMDDDTITTTTATPKASTEAAPLNAGESADRSSTSSSSDRPAQNAGPCSPELVASVESSYATSQSAVSPRVDAARGDAIDAGNAPA